MPRAEKILFIVAAPHCYCCCCRRCSCHRSSKKLIEFTLAKGKNVDKVVKLPHAAHSSRNSVGWRAKLCSFIGKNCIKSDSWTQARLIPFVLDSPPSRFFANDFISIFHTRKNIVAANWFGTRPFVLMILQTVYIFVIGCLTWPMGGAAAELPRPHAAGAT